MINVSRFAKRPEVARVESLTTQLLITPGQTAIAAAPRPVAGLLVQGITARLDVSRLLKLRLPRTESGPLPTLIAEQVRRARALLADRRQSAEEASLDATDVQVKALEAALAETPS